MVAEPLAVPAAGYTTQRLIDEAQAYSQEAWAYIYDEHFPRIYRYCYLRLGDQATSEDVASEVFLEAVRGIRRYEYRGVPLAAWLYRIAHNLLADHVRRNGYQKTVPLTEPRASRIEAPDSTADSAIRHDVQDALRRLPEDQKQVILLRFFEGLSHNEIAAAMGRRSGAVRALQHRALNALHRHMTTDVRR